MWIVRQSIKGLPGPTGWEKIFWMTFSFVIFSLIIQFLTWQQLCEKAEEELIEMTEACSVVPSQAK